MVFQPGSDQYPGIGSTAQLLRAYAALEAAGAYDTAVAVNTVGMSRVTLWGEYTRGAAGGAVDLLLEVSPWQAVNAPAGAVSEWYPMGMLELEGVAAGVDATNLIQRGIITYTSIDATRDSFTIDLSLPSYIERIRISARESGVVGTPGSFGLYATLSIVEGPDDGLMLTSQGEIGSVDSWRVTAVKDEAVNDSSKDMLTCPADTEYQILFIYIRMTSDAAAGVREMGIEIIDVDTDETFEIRCGATQAASLTRLYSFGASLADMLGFRGAAAANWLMTPIPSGLILKTGDILRVRDLAAIAIAADDMSVYVQYATRSTL